ncbi:FAD-binding oxidoreductase [Paenactinomyces guangxiensis]|uniref:FAD-binding protein n=1 Tax=Paenactinomyces guangxiensis TaxID=1490290 RepID=A0A7W1WPX9_9BACL|nr:FAD-linked oxidase C-terminal domain-containing protein [Paenactinomyces guangxiensis]MBA4493721.1 FAD-binding protein [Paenactinomyces guangxiensis]MBH8591009.1 FAD-binding protein [Paenactinomyces guangxiensis]
MLAPEAVQELKAIVGEERFRTDMETLVTHSYDATPMFQALPDGVIFPCRTEEVQAIMQVAANYRIPVISRGSGSNLSASTVPAEGGIVMVMTRMNRILEIDQENLTATVQPGVITKELHQAVEELGLFYPPDPGSMAVSTIGGNIAQCAGGLRGLKYGTTKDYVLGLEAVLASGEVIRTGGKLAKDVAGYDLTKLLVGSEGTLAIVTEATLKLLPKPEYRRVMVAHFTDLEAAAQTVSEIIANRIIPCTLEFLDQGTIQVVEEFANIGLPTDMAAILLMEQDGPQAVVDRDILRMEEICRKGNAAHVQVARTPEEGNQLLAARRSALSALARSKPTTILEDATVPRAAIATMVRTINEIARKNRVRICTFGHAGDGNLHPTCMTDARNQEEIERVEEAFAEIFAAALELGGTITGEHGVGLAKAPYLEWKAGKAGIEVLKGIKRAFDPLNLLNPGKIFAKETRPRVVITCPETREK